MFQEEIQQKTRKKSKKSKKILKKPKKFRQKSKKKILKKSKSFRKKSERDKKILPSPQKFVPAHKFHASWDWIKIMADDKAIIGDANVEQISVCILDILPLNTSKDILVNIVGKVSSKI